MVLETKPPTLLLTGSTSFIGFAILLQALKLGYNIVCPLRTVSKEDLITSHPLIKSLNLSQRLKFLEILDFSNQQAWEKVMQEEGVEYVIHLATPKPRDFTGDDEAYINTAVRINLAILHAGSQNPLTRRVVITSSMVAVRDSNGPASRAARGEDRLPLPPGPPYHDQNTRYTASKIAALSAIDSFISSNPDLQFKLVNIMPGFVVGRQELARKAEEMLRSSNRAVLIPVTGGVLPYKGTGRWVSSTVHLQDIVDLHLEALISLKLDGKREWSFAVAGMEGGDFESISGVVERLFPQAVREGRLKFAEEGQEGGEEIGKVLVYDVDVEGAEMVLGRKLRGLEEQVRDVVGCYLELVEKERREA